MNFFISAVCLLKLSFNLLNLSLTTTNFILIFCLIMDKFLNLVFELLNLPPIVFQSLNSLHTGFNPFLLFLNSSADVGKSYPHGLQVGEFEQFVEKLCFFSVWVDFVPQLLLLQIGQLAFLHILVIIIFNSLYILFQFLYL